jgi:hypothetical protein
MVVPTRHVEARCAEAAELMQFTRMPSALTEAYGPMASTSYNLGELRNASRMSIWSRADGRHHHVRRWGASAPEDLGHGDPFGPIFERAPAKAQR